MAKNGAQRLVVAFLLLASAACGVNLSVPSTTAISCDPTGGCPLDLVCVQDLATCVSPTTACVEKVGNVYRAVANANRCESPDVSSGSGVCFNGQCVKSSCGDGTVDFGEECDDGNRVDEDACRANCVTNVCGDGVVYSGVEGCDDANTITTDACLPGCIANVCGDGIINVGVETCEDQNGDENDGCASCRVTNWVVADSFGLGPWRGDPRLADISGVVDIAADPNGNVYIADDSMNVVWRLEAATNTIRIFAGSTDNIPEPPGEAVPALFRNLGAVRDVAVDRTGNVYVAQSSRLLRIDARTLLSTIVVLGGTYCTSNCGDGGPAYDAGVASIRHIAVDDDGRIYIADDGQDTVRRIGTDGIINELFTLAGVASVAVDGNGVVYSTQAAFSGSAPHRVYRWTSGSPTIFASTSGALCGGGACGDGGPAVNATFNNPFDIAVTHDGSAVYVSDKNDNRVRKIQGGTITTVAGNGQNCSTGDCNTDGPRLSVAIGGPEGLTLATNGDLIVVDDDAGRVKRTQPNTAGAVLQTIAGAQRREPFYSGLSATAAERFQESRTVAVTPDGSLHATEFNVRGIVRVDALGDLYYMFEGQPPSITLRGIGATADNAIVFYDELTARIRKVARDGTTTDIASGGFENTHDVAADSNGIVYVVDDVGYRIRQIDDGTVTSLIGDGSACASACGDGGPAAAARLYGPKSIVVAANDDIFFVDGTRIRRIGASDRLVTTVVSGLAFSPDGLAIAADGSLYFIMGEVLYRAQAGAVAQVSCTSSCTAGLGGQVGAYEFGDIVDVAVSSAGVIYVADYDGGVYQVGADGRVDVAIGALDHEGAGPFATARLERPTQLAPGPVAGRYLVSDGTRVRTVDLTQRHVDVVFGLNTAGSNTPDGTFARYYRQSQTASGIAMISPSAFFLSDATVRRIYRVQVGDANDPRSWPVTLYSGDEVGALYADGPIASARYNGPSGLAYDAATATLYIADRDNHIIRAIANGVTSTIAGDPGNPGSDFDFPAGIAALEARLSSPSGLTLDGNGGLLIADTGNSQVRRLDLTSRLLTVVLGDGTSGASGDGTVARTLPITAPRGIAVDSYGNIFVTAASTVREVFAGADGMATGDDPVKTIYGNPPRHAYPQSATACLTGIALLPGDAGLVVTDECSGFFVRLQREPVAL